MRIKQFRLRLLLLSSILVILQTFSISFSQSNKFFISSEHNAIELLNESRFFGKQNSFLYGYKSQINKLFTQQKITLLKLDSNLSIISSKKIDFRIDETKTYFKNVILLRNKILIFWSDIKSDMEHNIHVDSYDLNTFELLSKEHIIGISTSSEFKRAESIEDLTTKSKFIYKKTKLTVVPSKDGSRFGIISRNYYTNSLTTGFLQYSKSINIKQYDNDLKLISNSDINDNSFKSSYVSQVLFDKNDEFIFTTYFNKSLINSPKKSQLNDGICIIKVNENGSSLKYKKSYKSYDLKSFKIIRNKYNEILCVGFFKQKGKSIKYGTFMLGLDPETEEFIVDKTIDLVKNPAYKTIENIATVYSKVYLDSNQNIILIGEFQGVSGTISSSDNVIIVRMNPIGEIERELALKKRFTSTSKIDKPYYVSSFHNNKVYVLYPDLKENYDQDGDLIQTNLTPFYKRTKSTKVIIAAEIDIETNRIQTKIIHENPDKSRLNFDGERSFSLENELYFYRSGHMASYLNKINIEKLYD